MPSPDRSCAQQASTMPRHRSSSWSVAGSVTDVTVGDRPPIPPALPRAQGRRPDRESGVCLSRSGRGCQRPEVETSSGVSVGTSGGAPVGTLGGVVSRPGRDGSSGPSMWTRGRIRSSQPGGPCSKAATRDSPWSATAPASDPPRPCVAPSSAGSASRRRLPSPVPHHRDQRRRPQPRRARHLARHLPPRAGLTPGLDRRHATGRSHPG
jgi:hypothetical protein